MDAVITRKQRVAQRRIGICSQIMDAVSRGCEENKGKENALSIALDVGDEFINKKIKERPHEKEFILSCARRVVRAYEEAFYQQTGIKLPE